MTTQERFATDQLLATACGQTGLDDFGENGWQAALELLVDGLVNEARLSMIGVEVAYGDLMRALSNRLGVIDWRKKNPDVVRQQIARPIFIIGQPRTGTTILYDLLSQDPDLRAPLTWEVDEPCPVPRPETYHDDPRIAQIQSNIELSEQIVPGFLKFHPMGALVGQECVRITGGEFTSMIYSVQYRLPTYYRWLLYDADYAGAYRYHRIFLQHLQSGVPGQWLLKSPAHLWQLDTLLAEYPDALVVQTHRDPLNVISSIAALTHHLRRMSTDDSTIAECAAQSYEEIIIGLEREMALRDSGAVPDGKIIDVKFTDFMNDPWATIGGIYQALGRELRPDTMQRMRDFLAAHPSDGGRGRYTWSDTVLDADEVRERVRIYQDRYGIAAEQLR
jgi:Sulfotransferase family